MLVKLHSYSWATHMSPSEASLVGDELPGDAGYSFQVILMCFQGFLPCHSSQKKLRCPNGVERAMMRPLLTASMGRMER